MSFHGYNLIAHRSRSPGHTTYRFTTHSFIAYNFVTHYYVTHHLIIVAGSALARQSGGYGMMGSGYDRGYGNCNWNDSDRTQVAPETMAKFQKETLSLRDELITKRLELSQEYDKDTPDADRVAQLRKDMIDVQTKIQKVADKYDINAAGQGRRARGGYGRGNVDCGGGCN